MTVSFSLEELEASIDAARPYMMHEDQRLPALRLPIRPIAAGAVNTSVADLAHWMRLLTTVWIYVDTSKEVGDPDHLKVFADEVAANRWFEENDPEGAAFEYEVLECMPGRDPDKGLRC